MQLPRTLVEQEAEIGSRRVRGGDGEIHAELLYEERIVCAKSDDQNLQAGWENAELPEMWMPHSASI
jgi:hypothetical protein